MEIEKILLIPSRGSFVSEITENPMQFILLPRRGTGYRIHRRLAVNCELHITNLAVDKDYGGEVLLKD